MTSLWKQEIIKLRCEIPSTDLWGLNTVEGKVCGSLAIHTDEHEYVVTHVPTGMKIIGMPTERLALEVAEKLMPLDWGNIPDQLPSAVTLEAAKPVLHDYTKRYLCFEYEQCLLAAR